MQTPKGPGKVVDVQVLTQLVVVQLDNGDRSAWPVDEINARRGQASSGGASVPPPQNKEERAVDVLGDDMPLRDRSDGKKSEVNGEQVFSQIEAALDEVREVQAEQTENSSAAGNSQTNNYQPGSGQARPQGKSGGGEPKKDPSQKEGRGRNKRKNRKGRNRRRRPQGNSSGGQGKPSGPNKSSGSQGS